MSIFYAVIRYSHIQSFYKMRRKITAETSGVTLECPFSP